MGLAIGRIVFRALNIAEVIWAVVIAVCLTIAGPSGPGARCSPTATAVLLAVQLLVVRPRLNRRSARVLAGQDAPRSRAHHAYIGLEALKLRGPGRPRRHPASGMTIPATTHEGEVT